MNRRSSHQKIAIAATIPVVITGWAIVGCAMAGWVPPMAATGMFLALCACYIAFLWAFSVHCRRSVPEQLRNAPPVPEEFRRIRCGKIRGTMPDDLRLYRVMDTRPGGKCTHRLLSLTYPAEGGVWTCTVEHCADEVLAWSKSFRSDHTPALDRGESEGVGKFFPAG